jgi:hypothetical protein
LPNTDRPAAAAAQLWSARATIRNSAATSLTVLLQIVFYDTIGATLGTALATFTAGGLFTTGQVQTLSINGVTAPASTASVDVQVQRSAGGAAAIGDAIHFDQVTLTLTAAAVAYKDPAFDVFAVWTGTANASTQRYYTPVLTATTYTDAAPAPRIIVNIDDLPPAVSTLTMYRLAEGRTFKVRGAVNVAVAGGFSVPDVEAPFQVASSYRAQMFATGVDVGYTVTVTATLSVTDCWVHNTLNPDGAVLIDVTDASGKSLTRPVDGEIFYPEGRSLGVLISGRRRGLQGVELFFSTLDAVVAQKFEAMFGGYADTDQTIPIVCVRTPTYVDIPRTFYAGILSPKRIPVNVHMGGTLRTWETSADELAPPAAGLVVALLSRNDIDIFFATRNAMDAAYSSRLARDRDYTKAGLS